MANVSPIAVVALYTLMALGPLRRPPLLGFVNGVLSFLVNDLTFIAFYWLLAWTMIAPAASLVPSAPPFSRR